LAQTPTRQKTPKEKGKMKTNPPVPTNGKTPLEKMTDLTRRIVAVRKEDLPKPKKTKRKRH
jgi:hypothetical protein